MTRNPNTILFAGDVFDGRDEQHPLVKLKDGSTAIVRVWEMPARHHLELLELFHIGREADLIQRCCEVGTIADAGAITWQPLFKFPRAIANEEEAKKEVEAIAAFNDDGRCFVDSLHRDGHKLLAAACEQLNFDAAIETAQRQIARGKTLGSLMETIAKQVMAPMRKELDSWMSSLTTQISAALAAKKP